MSSKKIEIYDTTLRDGSQGEELSFSLQDKLLITLKAVGREPIRKKALFLMRSEN
jgi:hypothetical protein